LSDLKNKERLKTASLKLLVTSRALNPDIFGHLFEAVEVRSNFGFAVSNLFLFPNKSQYSRFLYSHSRPTSCPWTGLAGCIWRGFFGLDCQVINFFFE